MNNPLRYLSQPPWNNRVSFIAWFAAIICALLVLAPVAALFTGASDYGSNVLAAALLLFVLAVIATLGLLFIRWISNRRNFKIFLFGSVSLLTLIALTYTVENWRGKRAWRQHVEIWSTRGEPFTVADVVPPEVPDQENFALAPLLAPLLNYTQKPSGIIWHDTNGIERVKSMSPSLPAQRDTDDKLVLGSLEKGTFADLEGMAQFYRGNTNYPQAAEGAKPAEVILTALGKFDEELHELRTAMHSRPYSRFPIQYQTEPSWGILLPHLAPLKGVAQLVHVHATALLEEGRSAEAFEDLKLGLRISESISQEPLLINHLVRQAALNLSLQTVREGLVRNAWNAEQLKYIQDYLASVDLLAEYKQAIRGERALNVSGIDYVRRQGSRIDGVDYLDQGDAIGSMFQLVPSGWYFQNMRIISEFYQDYALAAVDAEKGSISPQISEQFAQATKQMPTRPYNIFAKLLLPAIQKATAKAARMQTYVDTTRIACALKRYQQETGNMPDSLQPLVPRFLERLPRDVIGGGPVHYKLNPSGYVLYSVGWNQTDEGGKIGWKKTDTTVNPVEGDWVFEMRSSPPVG